MLNSLTVKFRLIGFISMLLVLLIFTGLFGLRAMKNSDNSLSSIYNYQVIPLNHLRKLDNRIHINIVGSVDRLLFEQITWEECIVRVEKAKTSINNGWLELQKIQTGSPGTISAGEPCRGTGTTGAR